LSNNIERNNIWRHGCDIAKTGVLCRVVSIIAGLLGFASISAASADVARILFYILVVIVLVLLVLGLTIFRSRCAKKRGHCSSRDFASPAFCSGACDFL